MIDLGTYVRSEAASTGPRLFAEDRHLRSEVNQPWFRAYVAQQLGHRARARKGAVIGRAKIGADELARHGLLCGATGSGKSRLLEHLLDQQLREGCSVVLIDPKGDLANLLLNFPGLQCEEFLPWINLDDARQKDMTPEEYANKQADTWKNGRSG